MRYVVGVVVGLGMLAAACSDSEPGGIVFDPDVVRIVAIGDSITAGQCSYTDDRGDQIPGAQVYSYRFYLQEHIEAAGFELGVDYDFVGRNRGPFLGCGVIEPVLGNESIVAGTQPIPGFTDSQHEGWPGATAAQITERIAAGIGDPPPDIALVQVGTNDLFVIANQLELPWEPPPELIAGFEEDLRTLVGAIRAMNPGVTILLAQIPPCGFGSGFCDNPIVPMNDSIATVGRELDSESSPIVLVDQFDGFDVANLWDDIHPTGEGERLMAERWWDHLQPVLTAAVAGNSEDS